jgi:UDP-N-acetylmuramate--alanine ligase
MKEEDIQNLFFLGIGGIGMSALARYFYRLGYYVCGYDRTPSPLTHELEEEGIRITYDDDPAIFRTYFTRITPLHTLVVRTPAVPADSRIYTYLREQGFDIRKRAEVLGLVTRQKKALCVAGTHGKTTTSTMIAHLLQTGGGVNAFLGGISMNYNTNLLMEKKSGYVVVEADE